MQLVDFFESKTQKVGRWKVSLINLFISFCFFTLFLQISFFFSHIVGRLLSLCPPASLFFSLFLYSSVFLTVYPPSIHRHKIKLRARVHLDVLWHAIWYPERRPALGRHLCHSLSQRYCSGASPVAHNHPSIHPSIHPFIRLLVKGNSETVCERKEP